MTITVRFNALPADGATTPCQRERGVEAFRHERAGREPRSSIGAGGRHLARPNRVTGVSPAQEKRGHLSASHAPREHALELKTPAKVGRMSEDAKLALGY